MILQAIIGFRLVTADPDGAAQFYRALGFEVGEAVAIAEAEMELLGLTGGGRRIRMSLGRSRVDLDTFSRPGLSYPSASLACDTVFQHLALVTDDAAMAWSWARDAGAKPVSRQGPVTLPTSSGGVTAVKFRDPEGHPLEFLQFPAGSNPDWKGKGVMGIDHSAISVGDVAASRHFYARRGLDEGNATVNRGPAQDGLDGLDAVEVDVVPMNPATVPPHVELLGYRHPAGRKSDPPAPNDIAATRIVWRANGDALIRDPDGHLHQLSSAAPEA